MCLSWFGRGCTERANTTWPINTGPRRFREHQLRDPDIGPVLRWMESGSRPTGAVVARSSPAARHYWTLWKSLVLKGGILYKSQLKGNCVESYLQLVTPASMREGILQQMHDGQLAGHLGKKKTREKILERYYWFGVREDANNWVLKCDTCATLKHLIKALEPLLDPCQ